VIHTSTLHLASLTARQAAQSILSWPKVPFRCKKALLEVSLIGGRAACLYLDLSIRTWCVTPRKSCAESAESSQSVRLLAIAGCTEEISQQAVWDSESTLAFGSNSSIQSVAQHNTRSNNLTISKSIHLCLSWVPTLQVNIRLTLLQMVTCPTALYR
jgi:hypothetical protein